MPEFKEREDKLTLVLSATDNPVKLKVDCQFGTIANVSCIHEELISVPCGEEKTFGETSNLKGETIEFNGASGNPSGSDVKIIHTVYEQNGNKIIYTFPDDYTGEPEFDSNDLEPSYVFYIKFS